MILKRKNKFDIAIELYSGLGKLSGWGCIKKQAQQLGLYKLIGQKSCGYLDDQTVNLMTAVIN